MAILVFVPLWAFLIGFGLLLVLVMLARRRMRAIGRAARLFRSVAEGSSDGLVVMERDSKIIWTNEAYSRIMGYPHGDLIGRYPLEFVLPPRLAVSPEDARGFRFDENEERFGRLTQVENVRRDGVEFIHEFSHAVIEFDGEKQFLLAGRDITERVAREKALLSAQERLKVQSTTDALTGLFNRLHLQSSLEAFIRRGGTFAVLQVDVNRMKQVNYTFGHQAGDAMIVHVARAFKSVADPSWICARTGGDEFVALLPEVDALDAAVELGRDLARAAARPFSWKAATLRPQVSIGVALWDDAAMTADEVLNNSDVALYAAKAAGRDRVVAFGDALREKHAAEQAFETDVANAVSQRKFSFHFQPIFNMKTRRVEKFEMLVRWRHANLERMSPDRFLPLVDQLGLTAELDDFVVRSAEKAIARLNDAGLRHIGLSVNLSDRVFATDTITELLLWRAQEGCIDPARVTLEVLEGTAFARADYDQQMRLITSLDAAGFKIMLDDFGTGYAGLAHLALLPITGLKIDRGLTSGVDNDPTCRSIVTALVRLARELDLDVIAEGVENMNQLEIVHQAGCEHFQGFAIARPMQLKRAIAWARHDHAEPATGTNG